MAVTRARALGDYLRARRYLVSPSAQGIVPEPGRKVAGLRRSEVAQLAGVSEQYYLRLEQGRDQRPSDQVLTALGRALQLDEYALDYMFRVACATDEPLGEETAPYESMNELLKHWRHSAAYIIDGNHDIVASNALAGLIGNGMLTVGGNSIVTYFSQRVQRITVEWDEAVVNMVAAFRYHSDPLSPRLQEIVAELTRVSPTFAELWPRHDAWPVESGQTQVHLEAFGSFDVQFQTLVIPGRPRHVLTLVFVLPETPAAAAFAYLAARD